tara:strand:- start:546 stop:812 length:267 start_codon:yes stop_codon:yes gene_type:complete
VELLKRILSVKIKLKIQMDSAITISQRKISMKKIIVIMSALVMVSCGTSRNLTNEQIERRNKIDYELDKVYLEYSYKRDSLIIEFYKK